MQILNKLLFASIMDELIFYGDNVGGLSSQFPIKEIVFNDK